MSFPVECVECGSMCFVNVPLLYISPLFSVIRKIFGIQEFDSSQWFCTKECKEKFERKQNLKQNG